MKTIGLLGGMSWESTIPYYRILNETVKERLGGLHSARLLLYSVDFAEIEALQATGRWDESARILGDAAAALEQAGAELLVICTNTMHKVAPEIQARISIPLLHIADATADALLEAGISVTALLGTRYTMTQDFYRARLEARGLRVLTPEGEDLDTVHRIIYEELCLGVVSPDSRRAYQAVIGRLQDRGAQAVILGCTEIGLLIHQEDVPLPVFDTTELHARKAALTALGE